MNACDFTTYPYPGQNEVSTADSNYYQENIIGKIHDMYVNYREKSKYHCTGGPAPPLHPHAAKKLRTPIDPRPRQSFGLL